MLAATREASLRQASALMATRTVLRTSTGPMARIVSPTSPADVSRCVGALASAFAKVPCTNSFSKASGQTVLDYVDTTVRASIHQPGGTLVEAGDTSAVALWELPYTLDKTASPATSKAPQVPPVKKEWKDVVHRAKEKYIGVDGPPSQGQIRPHYHLDFLGRNPHVPKVSGAVSAVVRPFLARAEQDQLNVWLEATSPDVVTLYEYFGFKVVEEIKVGVGKFDGGGSG